MASNTIIQCSSSSNAMRTYDVFVSFRGETRNNFTGFLFEAMRRKGIEAFRDDKDIRKGESIAPELLQAIAGCRIFIVVFSKDYASSTWCLRELTEICNCIRTSQIHVLPVFYEVSPSEVRRQVGYYEEVFAHHEKRFKEDKEKMEEVKKWREALTQVANLSGWDIQNKQQHAEIEKIIQQITNILGPKFSTLPNDNLVGMESRLEELAKLLCLGSINDVRVVGISGMGGIGKSTLGRALYERISHQYGFRCYIDDVSKIYQNLSTLGVQKQLLSQSLNEKNLEICNVSEGTCLAWNRLRHARALIVLDNVDQDEQLNMFIGSRDTLLRDCLGGGSRIIIISRDQHILRTHGVDVVYQVQPLNYEDSVWLFCRKAFKSNYIMSDYQKLTYDALSHLVGHPLAIEVLGSSLFGRDVLQWRSALARLRENKSKKIMDVLRISFDELEDIEKNIFLDIACFWDDYDVEYVKEILDFRGFHPEYGLQVLADKSLITMINGQVYMHSLLRDLGKCIVREKSPKEPRKWSRLWDCKDLYKVMSDNLAAKNLEAIVIDYSNNFPQTTIRANALSKISHLKLLKFEHKINFSGRLDNLSNELGYLTWKEYPFECLPPCFQPDNLVELIMPNSSIKKLWEGTKPLHKLKYLNLSHSKNLIEMPDIRGALNLQALDLEGCIQLRQIDPSIGLLRKLTFLNLTNCKNLVSLPNSILGFNSLEYLLLSGCSKLYNVHLLDEPRDAEHLKKLYIGEAPIHSHCREHKNSVSCLLPSSPIFPYMHKLDLSYCNLVQIPDAIGNLCCLESLYLSGNNFATLPNLKELSKLFRLHLQNCNQLKYLPDLPSKIGFPSQTYEWDWANFRPAGGFLGLYVFNCPELVEWECCPSIGFSWMIQLVQVLYQYKILNLSMMREVLIDSVTPGSEIPRWFNKQHMSTGRYIGIDASSAMDDNNWIGVACCVVFVTCRGRGRGRRMGSLKDPPKTKRTSHFHAYMPMDLNRDLKLASDHSDHMWLFFVSQKQLIGDCLVQGTPSLSSQKCSVEKWEFELFAKMGHHVEVKKYGYRWVYKHDLELSNLTMIHYRIPSA